MPLSAEEQEKMVSDLETALDRLQALYNQYFMGIEKIEPAIPRKDVERKIQILRREKIRNTAVRFRFQTQIQKYNTQSNYWRRICRQIEEGTYQRDVMRAKKRSDRMDEAALASRALSELGSESEEARPVFDLSAQMGMDIDDPFAASHTEKPTQPPPAGSRQDPDKTPVPSVGSGIHNLHEKLISDARKGVTTDAADGGEDELASFFSRKSIPPPPPRAGTPPPPPSGTRKTPVPPAPREVEPRPSVTPPRPASRPRPEKAPAAPKPATRPASTSSQAKAGVSDERMKSVYRAYLAARKKTNEPTDNISFDKVSSLLKKQLATKQGVKDFKVVIRKGKAVIKTVKDEPT